MNQNNKEGKNVIPAATYLGLFQIRVKGQLDESWSDWLEGLEVKLMDNGEMTLSGHIRDQAELIGILNKLSRLNLTLLSVSHTDDSKTNEVNSKA